MEIQREFLAVFNRFCAIKTAVFPAELCWHSDQRYQEPEDPIPTYSRVVSVLRVPVQWIRSELNPNYAVRHRGTRADFVLRHEVPCGWRLCLNGIPNSSSSSTTTWSVPLSVDASPVRRLGNRQLLTSLARRGDASGKCNCTVHETCEVINLIKSRLTRTAYFPIIIIILCL